MKFFTKLFLFGIFIGVSTQAKTEQSKFWKSDKFFVQVQPSNGSNGKSGAARVPTSSVKITLGPSPDKPTQSGILGIDLPEAVDVIWECEETDPADAICASWGDYAKLVITPPTDKNCGRIERTSFYSRSLIDCYQISSDINWYGGGELFVQRWPIETQERSQVPFITGDHLANGTGFAGGVLEKYWLMSNGVGFFFDEAVPLYYKITTGQNPEICFTAKDDHPFAVQSPLIMKYSYCIADNVLEAHKKIQQNFFDLPTSIPEERMLLYPLWSTWAQYFQAVNQSIVLDFSRRIIQEGFSLSSHVEIDDNWEPCYGQFTFHPDKFPDPKSMIEEINEMGFNVTVWVTPFINYNCPLFPEGIEKDYFLRDNKGNPGISSWWEGSNAGAIDMTNPDAVAWWQARLQKLQQDMGVAAFKFDAGESNWLTYHPSASPKFDGDATLMPNLYSTKFVEACSKFGGLIETRTAHRNQKHGIFIRMMDKDSGWSYGNGLRSMIPTLLHFGILGYPFVLPDMIGGNAYGGRPSKELYVRWMQANVLMPSVQFSIVPWDFDQETVRLTREVLAIRNEFKNEILQAARQTTVDGSPINRPLWWLDPENPETFTIDSEYTLGDGIIVAPILDEGATSRDIYLPTGNWSSYPVTGNSEMFQGPVWIRDFPVPLSTIPIFIRRQ